jgi:UDP-N-acetyl-D-galactosamine dehydrogenase
VRSTAARRAPSKGRIASARKATVKSARGGRLSKVSAKAASRKAAPAKRRASGRRAPGRPAARKGGRKSARGRSSSRRRRVARALVRSSPRKSSPTRPRTRVAALPAFDKLQIAVIGLGYVGLPLAAYLGRHFKVKGFDISAARVGELSQGRDRTKEVTNEELAAAKGLSFTAHAGDLKSCNFFIVTVPTPIDEAKRPDVTALQKASETVGKAVSRGNVVVYESTVYPGATEEICVPIIERVSGLKYNRDFFAGYSPERINPGDKSHRLPDIRKITAGSTRQAAALIDKVYSTIITATTHKASSIRVAEAAKVIENIQRDVNIALINELAQLFKRMGLETREVLAAAGTKWNFHQYTPGLVGGHCIGVDPYYLTHKAQSIGFHPEMILAGRRINDGMAAFVAHDVVKTMVRRKIPVDRASVLVMGFTFKENCPDTRNTKVADLVSELTGFVGDVTVYDPEADVQEARHEYGIEVSNRLPKGRFDAVVLAVKHNAIMALGQDKLRRYLKPRGVLYDLKGVLPVGKSDGSL